MGGERQAEATTATIQYQIKCEDEYREVCPKKHYGGYGKKNYCKKHKSKVCYNSPKIAKSAKAITVKVPVAKEKCEERGVSIPKVKCEEVSEEKCFELPYTTKKSDSFEKCSTGIGPPKCEKTKVTLPKQVCIGHVSHQTTYRQEFPISYDHQQQTTYKSATYEDSVLKNADGLRPII